MNADPKEFKEAVGIAELSYKEVIEMAYYGAQVIHPKTIKPLQNKNIPLYVKPFYDLRLSGTVITNNINHYLPPVFVYKHNQALITLETLDFSFVEGKPLHFLNVILEELRIKPNLTQNAAISLKICIDDIPEKTEQLASRTSEIFSVLVQKNLTLITIRHYTPENATQLINNKEVLIEQKTPETIRILMESDQIKQ
jgi:aspartate kinase